MTTRQTWMGFGVAVALGALGCASQPPTQRMEASTAAIRAAEEVGAPKVPAATLHLQLAKEQADKARVLIAQGENEEAANLLLRAEADANLAVALARATTEQNAAQQAVQRVQELQRSNMTK